jgi:hypothetical protein
VRTAMAGNLPHGGSIAMTTLVLDKTWHQGAPSGGAATRLDSSDLPTGRNRTLWLGVAAFALVAALIGAGVFALGRSGAKPSNKATTATTLTPSHGSAPATTNPSPSTTATSQNPTALISAALPVVACPTSYAISPPPTSASLPSSMTESVPEDLKSQLSVFADETGNTKLLGPSGWTCNANYGADGSGGVTITPTGEALPPSGQISGDSTVEAIVFSETSACVSCREVLACPLFATAAADYQQDYQMTCIAKPEAESSEPIEDGVVGFLDPPGVAGDAYPSGGEYPANGVMTYHSGDDNGSWLDTCTLPYSQQALCTAVLNNFATTYGSE